MQIQGLACNRVALWLCQCTWKALFEEFCTEYGVETQSLEMRVGALGKMLWVRTFTTTWSPMECTEYIKPTEVVRNHEFKRCRHFQGGEPSGSTVCC